VAPESSSGLPLLRAATRSPSGVALGSVNVGALAAYGMSSSIGKVLEIHQQETPGPVHIVLIRGGWVLSSM
jgi:hypothetical protein